jgi:hypothetical protein
MLIILILRENLAEDYRDTIELNEVMDSIREKISIDEVQQFTIKKFCQRNHTINLHQSSLPKYF